MRYRALGTITLAALVFAPCWGCGPAEVLQLDTIPVKGKVTFRGRPLTQGVVEFEPRHKGRAAHGDLQPDGTFVLTSLKDGDGVAPGLNRVSISGTGPKTKSRKPQEIVPLKYTSPNTSGLQAEVNKDSTKFTFDLK